MKIDDFKEKVDQIINTVGNYSDMNYNQRIMLNGLALAGEAGEIANKIKKYVWYDCDEKSEQVFLSDLQEELGDVLYHVVQLMTELGLTPDTVMKCHIEKQMSRNDVTLSNSDELSQIKNLPFSAAGSVIVGQMIEHILQSPFLFNRAALDELYDICEFNFAHTPDENKNLIVKKVIAILSTQRKKYLTDSCHV